MSVFFCTSNLYFADIIIYLQVKMLAGCISKCCFVLDTNCLMMCSLQHLWTKRMGFALSQRLICHDIPGSMLTCFFALADKVTK